MESLISENTLAVLQAGSGLAFSSFLALHLTNALFAHGGDMAYDGVLDVFRYFYQNKFTEPVLIFGSLGLHIFSSSIRFYRRWKRKRAAGKKTEGAKQASPPWNVVLHRYSGYFLAAVIGGHIAATRLPYFLLNSPANFGLVSYSLHALPYFFYPYYFLLASCGMYHMSYGILVALRQLFGWRTPVKPGTVFTVAVGGACIACCSAVLAFGGVYFPIDKARLLEHHQFYKLFVPSALLPKNL